jgi:hypothetical protein
MIDPNTHPLDGCTERVDRAGEHLVNLRDLISATIEKHKNSFVVEFDPLPPNDVIRPRRPQSLPTPYRVGILIGEVLYNLRSALDYLVFELARHDSGSPQDDTQFLIESTPESFRGKTKRRLRGLNAAHIAAIERLQPYNGCIWTKTLRDLSNPDKHRELHNIMGRYSGQAFTRLTRDDAAFDRINAPITSAIHPVHGEVDVKFDYSERILFADGAPIMETLKEIKTQVAKTLADFKPEF